ncbi:MAG: dihydropteroate synthase [Mailhella sp.]|nr:dihydropteroate synthase [Mailhella sp.]
MEQVWMLRNGAFSPVSAEKQGGTPSRFTLWGVVNVTPDSFFDGGSHFQQNEALAHALQLTGEGARVLDLGGASSRPGAEEVPAEEEKRRVLPLMRELSRLRAEAGQHALSLQKEASSVGTTAPLLPAETLLSVDTWRADVAAAALENGADILNDISACAWEPTLRDVLSQYRPGYVLMHCMPGTTPENMQKAPRYDDIVDDILRFFEDTMAVLVKAGLPESHIMLDPGIGFGKTVEHNCALLANMDRIQALGRPLLLGVSNKSLFGHLLGLGVTERGEATRICTALLAARGVYHHRVHDIVHARQALILTERFTSWKD